MNHKIALILIGLREVDLIPLACFVEMHQVCQTLLQWCRSYPTAWQDSPALAAVPRA